MSQSQSCCDHCHQQQLWALPVETWPGWPIVITQLSNQRQKAITTDCCWSPEQQWAESTLTGAGGIHYYHNILSQQPIKWKWCVTVSVQISHQMIFMSHKSVANQWTVKIFRFWYLFVTDLREDETEDADVGCNVGGAADLPARSSPVLSLWHSCQYHMSWMAEVIHIEIELSRFILWLF